MLGLWLGFVGWRSCSVGSVARVCWVEIVYVVLGLWLGFVGWRSCSVGSVARVCWVEIVYF